MDPEAAAYLKSAGVDDALREAVRKAIRERPDDPLDAIGQFLLEQASQPPPALPASEESAAAAATIGGYLKCMRAKLQAGVCLSRPSEPASLPHSA